MHTPRTFRTPLGGSPNDRSPAKGPQTGEGDYFPPNTFRTSLDASLNDDKFKSTSLHPAAALERPVATEEDEYVGRLKESFRSAGIPLYSDRWKEALRCLNDEEKKVLVDAMKLYGETTKKPMQA